MAQMWASLIGKAKEGGLDVIQTYVFWNLHEPQPGQVSCITFSFFFLFLFSQIGGRFGILCCTVRVQWKQ